jgi:hypothetical protein
LQNFCAGLDESHSVPLVCTAQKTGVLSLLTGSV